MLRKTVLWYSVSEDKSKYGVFVYLPIHQNTLIGEKVEVPFLRDDKYSTKESTSDPQDGQH